MPRICLALLLAGFIAKLIPTEFIGHLIGYASGWSGIALAILFGGMMPSGPMIAFPVVVVLRGADAGAPQIVAFLTAWSVFAWHRVLIYEVDNARLAFHGRAADRIDLPARHRRRTRLRDLRGDGTEVGRSRPHLCGRARRIRAT